MAKPSKTKTNNNKKEEEYQKNVTKSRNIDTAKKKIWKYFNDKTKNKQLLAPS